jgi:hypothetical protein
VVGGIEEECAEKVREEGSCIGRGYEDGLKEPVMKEGVKEKEERKDGGGSEESEGRKKRKKEECREDEMDERKY